MANRESENSYSISSSMSQGTFDNAANAAGIAKFTASDYSIPKDNPERHYTVTILAVFDPDTKKWKAEILEEKQGR